MQIRLSQKNVELFEGMGVEMTSRWVNEFLFDKLSKAESKPSVVEELLNKILWKLDWIKESTPIVRKSWFSNDVRFSDKQLEMGNRIVEDIVSWVCYEGFVVGEGGSGVVSAGDYSYSIERAIPLWVMWDLVGFIKEEVRKRMEKAVEEGKLDIDLTLFKF